MRRTHRRPLHRFSKRPTFRYHLRAKHREKQIISRIAELPPLPPIEAATAASPLAGSNSLTKTKPHSLAEDLHDLILGGQDGLVNVLGSILGVAIVTTDKKIILVAGIAALLAESLSMAAVAYTSVKANRSYYESEQEAQRNAIEHNPILQKEILIDIYQRKGLTRHEAQMVVNELTKDKKVWLQTMLEEHLHIFGPESEKPLHSALVVGVASLIGSIIPVLPFIFFNGMTAIWTSLSLSIIALFIAGAASAKLTIGDWKTRGLELAAIGMTAALVSFGIGLLFAKGIINIG